MDFKTIALDKEGSVAWLSLNRPDVLNAINNEMRREFLIALDDVERDESARVLVLTGKGKAFCAGGDVKGMGKKERPINPKYIVSKIVNLEKPVVTAVNGLAVGGGCSLALSGDVIIASEEARFSQSFVRVGLVPDWGGMYFLPRLVGIAKAKELMLTGAMISAQEALAIGLVNRVVAKDQFQAAVNDLARTLAEGPPIAIASIKKVLNMSGNLNLEAVLDMERWAQGICRETEDHKEGLRAFKEKRKPNFMGK